MQATADETPQWFLLNVLPNQEKKVSRLLTSAGVEVFLPTYLATRQWSDRAKQVEFPVFPYYVFARFGRNERAFVSRAPGIRSVLGDGRCYTPVPEHEIANLRRALGAGFPFESAQSCATGQRVQIGEGSSEIEGVLVETGEVCRVAVNVTVLGSRIILTVPRDAIRLVES